MGRSQATLQTFRSVNLSNVSSGEWLVGLRQVPCRTGLSASEVLESLAPDDVPGRVDVVRCAVGDLCAEDRVSLRDLYECAAGRGLQLCPAALAPRLRLDYLDQPRGEWLYVAMRQMPDRDGSPSIFSLDCDTYGCWLRAFTALPSTRFHPRDVFVFVR